MQHVLFSDKSKDTIIPEVSKKISAMLSKVPTRNKVYTRDERCFFYVESDAIPFQKRKKQLLHESIRIFLYNEKLKFYEKNLNLKILSPLKKAMLLKSLVFAEFENEVKILAQSFDEIENIYFDGLKNFYLNDFEKSWSELTSLIEGSAFMFSSEDFFKKLIKSLVLSIKSRHKVLHLFLSGDKCLVDNSFNKVPFLHLLREQLSEEERIISQVLENFPQNLAIYSQNYSKELKEALNILYDAKKQRKNI